MRSWGPPLMPGGSLAAWESVKPILQAICARTEEGKPCCAWVGSGGAGHFVKMVHNGIEYGDMQLIGETYHLMRTYLGMTAREMQKTFSQWNQEELSSYLIGITADILAYHEPDGTPLLDCILDTAGQKGTGKWGLHSRPAGRRTANNDYRSGLCAMFKRCKGRTAGGGGCAGGSHRRF